MFGMKIVTDEYAIFEAIVNQNLQSSNALRVTRHVDLRLKVVVGAFRSKQVELDDGACLGQLQQPTVVVDRSCSDEANPLQCLIKQVAMLITVDVVEHSLGDVASRFLDDAHEVEGRLRRARHVHRHRTLELRLSDRRSFQHFPLLS